MNATPKFENTARVIIVFKTYSTDSVSNTKPYAYIMHMQREIFPIKVVRVCARARLMSSVVVNVCQSSTCVYMPTHARPVHFVTNNRNYYSI